MRITDLNSGREIGASCMLAEFGGLRLVIDCGMHPKHAGKQAQRHAIAARPAPAAVSPTPASIHDPGRDAIRGWHDRSSDGHAVPAPSMLVLFGAAASSLAARRRLAKMRGG